MPIRIRRILWSEENIDHIARHGVAQHEVEEVGFGMHFGRRVRGLYRLIGQTDAGRYLTVFLSDREEEAYYVVTARDATQSERRLYGRSRGR